jgi:hypothetical protein
MLTAISKMPTITTTVTSAQATGMTTTVTTTGASPEATAKQTAPTVFPETQYTLFSNKMRALVFWSVEQTQEE